MPVHCSKDQAVRRIMCCLSTPFLNGIACSTVQSGWPGRDHSWRANCCGAMPSSFRWSLILGTAEALTATEQQLKDFGEEEVPEAERSAWACWREEGERDEPESNELPSTKLQEEAIDGELDLEAPTKMESLRPYQLSAVDAVSKATATGGGMLA